MNLVDQAKSRLFHRVEKVLVTIESMLVAVFVGLCFYFVSCSLAVTGGAMLGSFILVVNYKRYKINKERKSK